MAAATITFYDSFREFMGDGTIDLDNDTFKLALCTSSYTPATSHSTFSGDITNELSTANGYTAGGATLSGVTWGHSSGTATFDDTGNVQWTASDAGITARYAILYSSTADKLVAYILLDSAPADKTATAGNTFTVTWNGSGIFTLTTP